jgi:HAD superfamily hydrolase (TIGR01450 family)
LIETIPGSLARLRSIGAFAFDMDGTTYLGGRLLPGVAQFLALLDRRGIPYVFLTNNSSKSRREYHAKLARLGLSCREDAVMTSGEATLRYLHRERPGARVFLLATPSFEAEAREAGIALVPSQAEADVLVLAYDMTLTFQRLADLCDGVRRGLPFIATHPDVNCPVDGGYLPDVGAFLACIEKATGRGPDLVVGKPGDLMVAALCERVALPAGRIAYVGDRLYTDVAMAARSGMLGVLVLSGETTLADLPGSAVTPDLVADGVGELGAWMG